MKQRENTIFTLFKPHLVSCDPLELEFTRDIIVERIV
jgi:hypothetical protein